MLGTAGLDGPAAKVARRGHRAHGSSVIRAIPSDDFVSPGEQTGHFHGVFIGFGAAKGEERLGQASDFGQLLSKRTARFGGKGWSGEAKLIDLILDGLKHLGMLVADVEINELGTEVEPLVALAVPEVDTSATRDFHGIGRGLD